MQIGRHEDVEYMETGKNDKKTKKVITSAGDYSDHMKYWRYGNAAFKSKALQTKMDEIYCGIDGNAWITDKLVQSDSNFISFSKKVLGIVQDEEKELEINAEVDDMDEDMSNKLKATLSSTSNPFQNQNNSLNGNNNDGNNVNGNYNGFTFGIRKNVDDNSNIGGSSEFKF